MAESSDGKLAQCECSAEEIQPARWDQSHSSETEEATAQVEQEERKEKLNEIERQHANRDDQEVCQQQQLGLWMDTTKHPLKLGDLQCGDQSDKGVSMNVTSHKVGDPRSAEVK